ncbi:hypothetical protein GCM10028796_55340 [Ramlibacter monticola]|uniref:Spore coat protein U domain-containing protein n=1 Tax=Ramlibacter monticola TaxID=1926872 RepID=A0A936Z7W6_9BURK|nr:spore coat U domain-containing protein [Ramlibacter monticola]MBL0394919.1 spore coat protein U domain-containing protein [Ramlibacter monticola]
MTAGLTLLLAAAAAHADTTCRLTAGASLAFGVYDPVSAVANDSLARVSAVCSRNGGPRDVTITLQVGQGTNGTGVNARRMANGSVGGEYLNYGLFRDTGRSAVWGFSAGIDTMSQSLSIDNNGSATATFTIYGRIPALQDVAIGSYSDAVTITVTP